MINRIQITLERLRPYLKEGEILAGGRSVSL